MTQAFSSEPSFVPHYYGPNVHILNDPFHFALLSKLCHPQTVQPQINQGLTVLYTHLLQTAVNREFKKTWETSQTRMNSLHPDHPLKGFHIDAQEKAVCVDLARAGILPSQVCYEHLHWILPPENLRQDHIFISRVTSTHSRSGVLGSQIEGHKIGGDVKEAFVIFADPMGATGSTLIAALDFYKKNVAGPAKRFLALHLIITPEYLKKMTEAHPDVVIYSYRVDRGLSPQKILNTELGEFWSEERGLNEHDYIVPGAGGFGEIMNNSFV